MPRDIRRIVTVSVCFGQRINALGEFEDFCEDVFRAIRPDTATAYFRRKYGDSTITINRVESDTSTYVLSFEDFLRHAHVEDEGTDTD